MAREYDTPDNALGFPVRLYPVTITLRIELYADVDGSQPTSLTPNDRAKDIVTKLMSSADDRDFLIATHADVTVAIAPSRLVGDEDRGGKWIVIEDEDGVLLV